MQRWIDLIPSLNLFAFVYLLVCVAETFTSPKHCEVGPWCMTIAFIVILVMFGAAFFAPILHRVLKFLQPSPIVRMIQMLFAATPVTPDKPPPYVYLGDGGLIENSGCLELLRRRVPLILVMEAGDDPQMDMITLNLLIRYATDEKICSFFVKDSEDNQRMSVQERIQLYQNNDTHTFLHLGILYDWGLPMSERRTGDLLWIQNRPSGPTGWIDRPQCTRFNPYVESEWDQQIGTSDIGYTESASSTRELQTPLERSQKPLSELRSICWDGRCCFPCGTFPTINTANQFFSPTMAANFINFGYLLSEDAVDKLIELRGATEH